MSSKQYNTDEYILTPCRFAPSGWKYVKKKENHPQRFLNHLNKRNSVGYYSNVPTHSDLISINNQDTTTCASYPVSTYKETFVEKKDEAIINKLDTTAEELKF